MLERFVKLHRSSDEEIFKYAKDWGVLQICIHGYPASHSRSSFADLYPFMDCEVVNSPAYPGYCCEDVAQWRRFSLAADTTVQLAAKLSRSRFDEADPAWNLLVTRPRQPGLHQPKWIAALSRIFQDRLESHTEVDWKFGDLTLLYNIKRRLTKSEKLQGARGFLAREIQTWIRIGDAGLSCYCEPNGAWRMTFSGSNTFGILALQLMFKIANADGIVICSTCSRPYLPNKRRPSAGRANYCDECKVNGTMWREIKRLQRRGK
jgi:hypothetical protein